MAHTFTQILIHCVFAVKHRESLITPQVRESVEKYITGIVKNNRHKLLAIFCMPDHCHMIIGLDPQQSVSELVRDVKANSSKWINEQKFFYGKFNWQEGYGAFSYSKSRLDVLVKYVLNQPIHHQKKSFKDEYHEMLEKFNLEYDEKFLFDWNWVPPQWGLNNYECRLATNISLRWSWKRIQPPISQLRRSATFVESWIQENPAP